jgi:hypothetical protein
MPASASAFRTRHPNPARHKVDTRCTPVVTAVISNLAHNTTMHKRGATYTLRTRVPLITISHHDQRQIPGCEVVISGTHSVQW